eukprot:9787301-Ditylum_brightwellii.AAC.1
MGMLIVNKVYGTTRIYAINPNGSFIKSKETHAQEVFNLILTKETNYFGIPKHNLDITQSRIQQKTIHGTAKEYFQHSTVQMATALIPLKYVYNTW